MQQNSRQTNTEISKHVGISSPAVAERIRKMEDAGIIEGYYTKLSYFETGNQLTAIITLRAFMGKLKPFLVKVKSFKEVINCFPNYRKRKYCNESCLKRPKTFRTFHRSINKIWRNENPNCTI